MHFAAFRRKHVQLTFDMSENRFSSWLIFSSRTQSTRRARMNPTHVSALFASTQVA